MWHCIRLGEHFAYIGAALLDRLAGFWVEAAAQVNPLPEVAIFSYPLTPYDSEVLYLAPGSAEFLRPALAELTPEPCEPPASPDDVALFFHYGLRTPS